MTAESRIWPVRLTATAEADFRDILQWTVAQFGIRQAREHAETLSAAIAASAGGPTIPGARERPDILKGIYVLHVTRRGRKGRHFVMFRVGADRTRNVVEILRLLHDSMDLKRHLPPMNDTK